MAENEQTDKQEKVAVKKKASKKKASRKKATRKKVAKKDVTKKATVKNTVPDDGPFTRSTGMVKEADPDTVAVVATTVTEPTLVTSNALTETNVEEVQDGQFADFMLKALVFWIMVAAIGLYLYTLYTPEDLSFTPVSSVSAVPAEVIEETFEPVEVEAVPTVETQPRFVPAPGQVPGGPVSAYRPLPPEQIQMIIRTFAPEQMSAGDEVTQ